MSAGPLSSAFGNWTITNSPNTSGAERNILNGVTCVSGSDCWAVGQYYKNAGQATAYQTLIEHFDGSSWNIVSSPNRNTSMSALDTNVLYSIACSSASECWAIGLSQPTLPAGPSRTLIERFDGTSWSIMDSPNASMTANNLLIGVTCTAGADCWAVGYYNNTGTNFQTYQTLIEHYDGASWTIASSANTAPVVNNYLDGVTCTASNDCWAIGFTNVGGVGTIDQTLTEHFNGTSWSVVNSPSTSPDQTNLLRGVTCSSSTDCWAVGFYSNGNNAQTLIEHYDGTAWTIVNSPNTSSTDSDLFTGVACVSATDCAAAGAYFNGSIYQTLIEQFDRGIWNVVSSPSITGSSTSFLNAVSCAATGDCWAVGYYYSGSVNQTLIEHRAVSSPILVSAVSSKVHGSAGSFDINLPLTGTPGIECRSGGVNNDYTLIFTFANTLSSVGGAGVTSGTGSVSSANIDSSDAHNYIVNLTGVTNAQVITVSLANVSDSAGNFSGALSASMGVLLGDTNGSGRVDAADVSSVRQQTLQLVTSSNFREDVNTSGRIDAADVSLVRQQTLTSLP
jgi:hypothetical protein